MLRTGISRARERGLESEGCPAIKLSSAYEPLISGLWVFPSRSISYNARAFLRDGQALLIALDLFGGKQKGRIDG
jgi:hypothetical protein